MGNSIKRGIMTVNCEDCKHRNECIAYGEVFECHDFEPDNEEGYSEIIYDNKD